MPLSKRHWITILLLFSFQAAFPQSVPRLLEYAEEMYNSHRYFEAIEFYEKIAGLDKTNHEVRYRLANCYQETLQYAKAKKEFETLGTTPDQPFRAWSLFYYANLLMHESEFAVADSIFNDLVSLPDASPELVELSGKHREGCQLALRQRKENKGFTIEEMEDVNSRFHDFGAIINPSNDHLVFATTSKVPGVQYDGTQFEGLLPDLVSYERRRNGRWSFASSDQRFNKFNTQWAEGSGSFTADGTRFYFTSCHGVGGSDCSIQVSYLIDNVWTDPVVLNEYINEPGSENKQPYISSKGDTLFFSSDRPGGFGGSDIWMSLSGLEADSWSPAINVGNTINSVENEISPYFSAAYNCLLFASDGHVGYGGFDIYAAKGESFFEPHVYNLGAPFNSTWDDTYFNISDSIGFLSSNRKDGKILNLYQFKVSGERLFLSLLISGESLINSRIVSRFRDTRSMDIVTLRVEDYQGYELFEAINYEKPKPRIIQESYASDSAQLAGDSVRRANALASLSGLSGPGDDAGGDLDEGRITDDVLDRLMGKVTYEEAYEKIFFDFGEDKLKPEGKVALESLLSQVPVGSINKISLFAFTDNLGSESFNRDLSKKRGESVKQFLLSKGVAEGKVFIYPRGQLVSQTEIDHWYRRIFRRRVEVTIETSAPVDLKVATTYIVRRESTFAQIASQIGTDTAMLESWNGYSDRLLSKGTTIRVFGTALPNVRYFVTEANMEEFIRQVEKYSDASKVLRN